MGQFGNGSNINKGYPIPINFGNQNRVSQVSSRGQNICAVIDDDTLNS